MMTNGSPNDRLKGSGFFRLTKVADRWTIVHPKGGAFLSIGVNHADETNLKYPHNIEIWRARYGSRDAWIKKGVVADLTNWGFNTLGWTQEYISGEFEQDRSGDQDWFGPAFNLGHSSPWAASELKSSGLPYVLVLPVAEIQDWRADPTFPDVFSKEFDQWCAYLARSICLEHADSQSLIGYFLADVPAWLPHSSGKDFPNCAGLGGRERDKRIRRVAARYYETITSHIRAIDEHHLILGDRFNGNKGFPDEVLETVAPFIDAVSIQYFCGPAEEDRTDMVKIFAAASKSTGLPTFNADIGNWTATKLNPKRATGLASQADRAASYVAAFSALLTEPSFVGWHWCSYLENTARGWGLKDPWDEPYEAFVNPVRDFNHEASVQWKRRFDPSAV